jgi:hypothetical protein
MFAARNNAMQCDAHAMQSNQFRFRAWATKIPFMGGTERFGCLD